MRSHSTADWMGWLQANSLLIPTAPRPASSCGTCLGAVGVKGPISLDGEQSYWDACFQCQSYSGYLDDFIPITYSVKSGLESLLHRYKDFGPEFSWVALPLGGLLWTFARKHLACITRQAQGIDVAVYVPSNDAQRTFNQLDGMIDSVEGSPLRELLPWRTDVLTRNFSVSRPERAEVKPDAYVVDADAVTGKSVLVLDDTWTSGSSLVSCAAALKGAGATYVVGLTIGRQLNESAHYGSTDQILIEARGRRWTDDDCVLCV